MKNEIRFPTTLVEAVQLFADPENAWLFAVRLRWPNGPVCPFCEGKEHSFLSTRKTWQCKGCGKQFSVKKGSIFEDSPLPLGKWLIGMWLICNAKNGISSYELSRGLGVTQKSAWFMLHRIRLALQSGSFDKIAGDVEVDETFIGGKARNMHHEKRPGGTGGVGKVIVMGFLERDGKVRTFPVSNPQKRILENKVREHVEEGSQVFTDAHGSYRFLGKWFDHQVIDHAEAYVVDNVHTNGLENYWSLLKRTISGTYVSVEPFHLFRYLDEQAFRFNERESTDGQRFTIAASSTAGKRLTYRKLTGKELAAATDPR